MLSNRKDSSNIACRIEAIERGSPPPIAIGTNRTVDENNNIVLDSGDTVDSADTILLHQRKKMVHTVVHCLGLYGTFF